MDRREMTETQGDVADLAEPLFELDRKARDVLHPHHRTPLVRGLRVIGEAGDQPQLRLLCAGVALVGLMRGDAKMVRAGARMLLAHEVATAAKSAVKASVDRWRPRSSADGKDHRPQPGGQPAKELSSFPSGHSAGALAVAAAFAAEYPQHRTAALGAAGAIGAIQVPTCAHYPSDVLAGWTVGGVAAALVNRLFGRRGT
ncbi:phosphatase PAP2 family protein [Croceibacterium sp. TMG7-5b_MA50]|uniref:phosphatase PAP2 family protein n=1 Tax=Croceibacterium sp. TMG7-5b_MA50 TaxID=3121290 RepID=UPI0032213C31